MSAEGICFEASLAYMISNPQLTLVHGLVIHPELCIQHPHAWLEDGTDVIDVSADEMLVLPKMVYYAIGGINYVIKYNIKEVYYNVLRTKHSGPWDKKLLEMGTIAEEYLNEHK